MIYHGGLENHHIIGIQTRNMLIAMEQILGEIDQGKLVMTTTCK